MKKILFILSLFISAISFGQVPNFNIAYLYGDSATYMGSRDTLGYHPTRAGAIVFHYGYFWGWNGTAWGSLGSGSAIVLQPLVWDATMTGTSPYDGTVPRSTGVDTVRYIATKSDLNIVVGTDTIT
jgi:hypothetical protein